jgi:hypothetical protein
MALHTFSAFDVIGAKAMSVSLYISLMVLTVVLIISNAYAYVGVRRLGYFQPAAVFLVLGVDAVTLLAVIGVIVLLPGDYWEAWGGVLVGIISIGVMTCGSGAQVAQNTRFYSHVRASTRAVSIHFARLSDFRRRDCRSGRADELFTWSARYAERLCSLHVDDKLAFGRLRENLRCNAYAIGFHVSFFIWGSRGFHQHFRFGRPKPGDD